MDWIMDILQREHPNRGTADKASYLAYLYSFAFTSAF